MREVTVLGSSHGTRADLAEAVRLATAGEIAPRVSQVLPFEHAAAAHAIAERGSAMGRVVLVT